MKGVEFRSARASIFAVLACCLSGVSGIGATSFEPMTGEQILAASELIVVGRCTSAETRVEGRRVTTFYKVTVEDALLGEATEVEVAVPGGIDTEGPVPISHNYFGAVHLRPNQDYLLFLTSEGTSGGAFAIVGLSQGLLPIETASGKAMAVRRGRTAARGMLLDAMKRQIRGYLEQARESR